MENVDATSAPTCTGFQPKNDLPNFAAWNLTTLVSFAKDAYVRMQQQQDALEQCRLDLRDAMGQIRKQLNKDDWR